MNLLFLVNIIRILVTKLKDDNFASDHQQSEGILQVRKALRATLILFPLLGMTNLLFFINPKNGTHDKIYVIFNATMQSSQGIFLAILYCFLNSEVQQVIKRRLEVFLIRYDVERGREVTELKFLPQSKPAVTTGQSQEEVEIFCNSVADRVDVDMIPLTVGNPSNDDGVNVIKVELNHSSK